MNTNDFSPLPGLTFQDIFKKQTPIMINYEPELEERLEDFDIDILEDQELFKVFTLCRFVEELTEATVDTEHWDHFEEEIIDAFNFLVETYIIYGWDYSNLTKWNDNPMKSDSFDENEMRLKVYDVIEQTGKTCNYLKNRKWRFSQYLVDLMFFEIDFKNIWEKFNELCNNVGISEQRLLDLWSLKAQVNLFRLTSNY